MGSTCPICDAKAKTEKSRTGSRKGQADGSHSQYSADFKTLGSQDYAAAVLNIPPLQLVKKLNLQILCFHSKYFLMKRILVYATSICRFLLILIFLN